MSRPNKLTSLKERSYEDYEAACFKIKGMLRSLKKDYEDKTIRLALDKVTGEMLKESEVRQLDDYLTGEDEYNEYLDSLDNITQDY